LVPFSAAFQGHRLAERVQRLRQNRPLGYVIASALLAGATAVRWGLGEFAIAPFTTLYPAITIAVLLGGLGPGLFAVTAATLLAWFFFIPPQFSFAFTTPQEVTLLLFVGASLLIVALVSMLNSAIDRLITQERNVRLLVESAPNGIVVVDENGVIKLVNTSTERLFGYETKELIGRKVEDLVPNQMSDAHRTMRALFMERPEARPMGGGRDLSGRRKDGTEFSVEIGLNPVEANRKRGVLATVIDISERKQAQDRQQFLVRELQHRSKNLFAVIESIATRSLVEGQSIAEAKAVFTGRLHALAQAHSLLAEAPWKGIPLADLLQREMTSFSNQFAIEGCDLVVNTLAAQQFALIVHELATNAAKYGALSTSDGRVEIEGQLDGGDADGMFAFTWREVGGPIVSEPSRKGFGSVILLDAAKQFGKRAALNFHPEGLHYELHVPLHTIQPSRQRSQSQGAKSQVAS
jgi:PAS domain S-box-containing protein